MNLRLLFALLLISAVACNDDTEQRQAETSKELKKQEAVFDRISKAWNFNSQPANPTAKGLTANWEQWRVFLNELADKPKSSIGAFRKKAGSLSQKAKDLNRNIPAQFNKPEVRSRISVLTTKVNSLYLFISLDEIPDRKVVELISEINSELLSLQSQMAEIVRKSQIPKEEGESDMIRMLDTSRAIPNEPIQKPEEIEPRRRFP